uniref:Uncharacterized protein n=1 Tax=Leishmania guyanensis TaxID=5670 RepID=A0A1E1IQW9_LEIGU|nr:Hypothetical protein BN36_1111540 [Leishmania guyanensis]
MSVNGNGNNSKRTTKARKLTWTGHCSSFFPFYSSPAPSHSFLLHYAFSSVLLFSLNSQRMSLRFPSSRLLHGLGYFTAVSGSSTRPLEKPTACNVPLGTAAGSSCSLESLC